MARGLTFSLALLLMTGCAMRADTLKMQRDIATLQEQQEQILDQLAELEETRAKVNVIEQTLAEIRWQSKSGTMPDTSEVLDLLATERQRTEQRLALVQEMLNLIEDRLSVLDPVASSPESAPTGARPPAPPTEPTPPAPTAAIDLDQHPDQPDRPTMAADTQPPPPTQAMAADTAPLAEPVADGSTVHLVTAGETLGTIARDFLGHPRHWKAVWRANPQLTDPDHLEVGMKLTIPGVTAAQTAPATGSTAPATPIQAAASDRLEAIEDTAVTADASTIQYTVRPGDTLGTIARDFLGNSAYWDVVWMANPGVADPDTIEPGQVLVIPPSPDMPVTRTAAPRNEDNAPSGAPSEGGIADDVMPDTTPVSAQPDVAQITGEPGVVRHTVTAGESLGSIANAYLGDPGLWEWVWEANPHLNDPDRLEAGQVLLVPVLGGNAPMESMVMDESPTVPPAPPTPPAPPAAKAPPAPPTPPTATVTRHKVMPGETLGTIARDYLGDAALWRLVWKANPWLENPDHLAAGNTVVIPVISGDTARHHTVASNETLGTIAALYFGDPGLWKLIWKANPTLADPNRLHTGMVLVIPVIATDTGTLSN